NARTCDKAEYKLFHNKKVQICIRFSEFTLCIALRSPRKAARYYIGAHRPVCLCNTRSEWVRPRRIYSGSYRERSGWVQPEVWKDQPYNSWKAFSCRSRKCQSNRKHHSSVRFYGSTYSLQ